ncbi:MAG: hypothetical protein AAGN15_02985 [Cyanobacteria bacterium J06581_3]
MPAKRHSPLARLPWSLFPASIVIAGIILTLWLQRFTPSGVLFNGGAGLNSLMVQQLAQQISTGDFPLDVALNLSAADWVKSVWETGLYPFSPPFVYEVGARHFTAASFIFPIISAPFYVLFGDRGLSVIPLAALWLIWCRFWQIGLRAGWGLGSLCIGLVSLIFASPLTLYGGVFLEYSLAVALAFWGVSGLIFPEGLLLTRRQSLVCGVLIGLAVWFRPEFWCLMAAVSFLALIGWMLPKWKLAPTFSIDQVIVLIGAMACTAGVLLAINYAVYGIPLGIRELQFLRNLSVSAQLQQAGTGYAQVGQALQQYFPVIWVVALAAIFSPELKQRTVKISPLKNNMLKNKKGLYFDRLGLRKTAASILMPGRFALALCLLFAVGAALLAPPDVLDKQWGPRLYFILIPLLSLVLAEQLRPDFSRLWGRRLVLGGIAVALVLGIKLNVVNGAFSAFEQGNNTSLRANYEMTAPAIASLQADPHALVGISHEFVAQQLWSALPGKTFFLTETIEQVKQLAGAMVEQGEREFLYMCYPYEACSVPEATGSELNLDDGVHTLNLMYVDEYGAYPTYSVEIAEIVSISPVSAKSVMAATVPKRDPTLGPEIAKATVSSNKLEPKY